MIASLYRKHNAFSNREGAQIFINPNKNIEQWLLQRFQTLHLVTMIASCKEDFLVWHPMFATSLATKNCVACCRESRSSFYFSQCYATSCSVSHPKELITIRHNQNAADIFKYSVGVNYNLIAGRKTSCVRLTLHARTNCLVWHGF